MNRRLWHCSLGKSGRHIARTDVDKGVDTGGRHRLEALGEAHRAGELAVQGIDRVRHGRRIGIRPHRELGGCELDHLEGRGEIRRCRLHER